MEAKSRHYCRGVFGVWLCVAISSSSPSWATDHARIVRLPPVEEAVQPIQQLAIVPTVEGIIPVAWQTETARGDARRFRTSSEFVRPTHLANSFSAFPEFAGGITVIGENAALKIGGYVKADLIKDFDAIDSTDSFDTTRIPTGVAPRENARFHARQSRLSFDTRWQVDGDVAQAFIEGDFFGGEPGSENLRLRHAYGSLGYFTVGQTWSTFTDPAAVPATLDFEGAVSNVNRRQGLLRYERPLHGELVKFAIAVEDPQIEIQSSGPLAGAGRTETPDLIIRLRSHPDWGEFQIAYVLRELGYQPINRPVFTETAWGINATGAVLLLDESKIYYQVTLGEGIGSYRGSPDVVRTGPATAEILPMFGVMIGAHQAWTSRLTSNLTFSALELDNVPGQDASNLRRTTYVAVNLIGNPSERVFCGFELLYGIREEVDGTEADARRLQLSFGFTLP